MTTEDLIIAAISIAGMWACIAMQMSAVRIERRLGETRAERLLDGERFPLALTHYEGDER